MIRLTRPHLFLFKKLFACRVNMSARRWGVIPSTLFFSSSPRFDEFFVARTFWSLHRERKKEKSRRRSNACLRRMRASLPQKEGRVDLRWFMYNVMGH